MLIVNADDWGRSAAETDAALACFRHGSVTSVTAMVYMEDSERAASLAREHRIDAGLHINLSQPFTANGGSARVMEAQRRVSRFVRSSRYAVLLYHPWLRTQFVDAFQGQLEEFERLYGRPPTHFDGHQHRHLCANMLLDRVVPPGRKLRRNFTFRPGQKSALNRAARRWLDGWLARSYRITDGFFALSQHLEGDQLRRVVEFARGHSAELMTHPVVPREREALLSPPVIELLRGAELGSYARL